MSSSSASGPLGSADPAHGNPDDQHPEWRRNMYGMSFAGLFHTLGVGMTHPFLALIFLEMGATGNLETWVGYGVGGYFCLSFLLTPLWGGVGDHYGRKIMVMRTSIGMGLIYSCLAWSPNLHWMLIGYILLGTTNGFVPNAQALLAINTPRGMMGKSLSTLQAAILLGSTVAPGVAALALPFLPGYRYLFSLCGLLILTGGTLVMLLAKEEHTRPSTPFRMHVLADLLATARIPGIGPLMLIQLIYAASFMGSSAVISVLTLDILADQNVTDRYNINLWVTVVSLALPLASVAGAMLWGRLIDRYGSSLVMSANLLLGGLVLLSVLWVTTTWQLAALRFALGAFAVGLAPANITLIRMAAPKGMESRVLAFSAACGALGIGLGPLLAGQIGPLVGLRVYFALNGVSLLVGLAIWLPRLRHHR